MRDRQHRSIYLTCRNDDGTEYDGTIAFELQANGDILVSVKSFYPDHAAPERSQFQHINLTLRADGPVSERLSESSSGINQPRELANWIKKVVF